MRSFHKFAGAILAIQIILWIVTGFLFNYKYRYEEAYEHLAAAPSTAVPSTWTTPAESIALAGLQAAPLREVRLLHDARGYLYLIETGTDEQPVAHLASASTGAPVSPLDAAGAEAVLRSAIAGSKHAARYGAITGTRQADASSALLGRITPGWQFALSTGQTVTVNALTAEITHTALLNDWIDWTYRVHYMQYTPWKSVNIAIVAVFLVLLLSLVSSGLRMLLGTRPKLMFGSRSSRRGSRIRF